MFHWCLFLILIILDVAFWRWFRIPEDAFCRCVLILIILDVAFWCRTGSSKGSWVTVLILIILDDAFWLNPTWNLILTTMTCLNPYYSGWYLLVYHGRKCISTCGPVLILVVLDVAFRFMVLKMYSLFKSCLNPYCSGCCIPANYSKGAKRVTI